MDVTSMLMTAVAVTAVLALAMAGMSLGILLGRRPLRCGCRSLAAGDSGERGLDGVDACEGCPHRERSGER